MRYGIDIVFKRLREFVTIYFKFCDDMSKDNNTNILQTERMQHWLEMTSNKFSFQDCTILNVIQQLNKDNKLRLKYILLQTYLYLYF